MTRMVNQYEAHMQEAIARHRPAEHDEVGYEEELVESEEVAGVGEEHRCEPVEGRGVLEGHQIAKASVSEDEIAGVQCQTYRQCNQQTKGKNKQAQRKCESNPRVQSAKRSPCNAYGDTHTTRCIACFSLSYHGRAVTNNMQRVCARVPECARECTCVCMDA